MGAGRLEAQLSGAPQKAWLCSPLSPPPASAHACLCSCLCELLPLHSECHWALGLVLRVRLRGWCSPGACVSQVLGLRGCGPCGAVSISCSHSQVGSAWPPRGPVTGFLPSPLWSLPSSRNYVWSCFPFSNSCLAHSCLPSSFMSPYCPVWLLTRTGLQLILIFAE